jgi:hypothetical protein
MNLMLETRKKKKFAAQLIIANLELEVSVRRKKQNEPPGIGLSLILNCISK